MDPLFRATTTDAFAVTLAAVADLEALVRRASSGDDQAWSELGSYIAPLARRIDRHDIIAGVMAQLRAANGRRLASYITMREARPSLRFETWLRVIAKRVAIEARERERDERLR